MISALTSKCQDFKLRVLQFHFIKQLKIRNPKSKSKALHVIKIKCSSWWEWQPSLSHSFPLEHWHFTSYFKILCTILHTTVYVFCCEAKNFVQYFCFPNKTNFLFFYFLRHEGLVLPNARKMLEGNKRLFWLNSAN